MVVVCLSYRKAQIVLYKKLLQFASLKMPMQAGFFYHCMRVDLSIS